MAIIMTLNEGASNDRALKTVEELVRNATRNADIEGTRRSLTEIVKKGDPRLGTYELLSQVKKLVIFDGRPLLQERLEEALLLLDSANAIETTQEIIDLRAKVDCEIERIAREKNIPHY